MVEFSIPGWLKLPASTTLRCLIVVAVLSAAQLAIWQAENADKGSAHAAYNLDVTQLPMTLGEWSGQEFKSHDNIAKVVGAVNAIERKYTSSKGDTLFLSLATYPGATVGPPHLPRICYAGGGWKVLDETWQSATSNHRYKLLRAEKDQQVALVSFWYQQNNIIASTRDELRKNLQTFRWKREHFPPLVKVMIHANVAFSEADAKSASEELGAAIYEWIEQNS